MKSKFLVFKNILLIGSANLGNSSFLQARVEPPKTDFLNKPKLKFNQEKLTQLNQEKGLGLSKDAIETIYANEAKAQGIDVSKVELSEKQVVDGAKTLYQTGVHEGTSNPANQDLFVKLDTLDGNDNLSFDKEANTFAWNAAGAVEEEVPTPTENTLPDAEVTLNQEQLFQNTKFDETGKPVGEQVEAKYQAAAKDKLVDKVITAYVDQQKQAGNELNSEQITEYRNNLQENIKFDQYRQGIDGESVALFGKPLPEVSETPQQQETERVRSQNLFIDPGSIT